MEISDKNMFCESESLSNEAIDLAKLAHWVGIACLCGKAFEMAKIIASPLKLSS